MACKEPVVGDQRGVRPARSPLVCPRGAVRSDVSRTGDCSDRTTDRAPCPQLEEPVPSQIVIEIPRGDTVKSTNPATKCLNGPVDRLELGRPPLGAPIDPVGPDGQEPRGAIGSDGADDLPRPLETWCERRQKIMGSGTSRTDDAAGDPTQLIARNEDPGVGNLVVDTPESAATSGWAVEPPLPLFGVGKRRFVDDHSGSQGRSIGRVQRAEEPVAPTEGRGLVDAEETGRSANRHAVQHAVAERRPAVHAL